MQDETKTCPYCGEEIKAVAVKCRYCGIMLNSRETIQQPQNVWGVYSQGVQAQIQTPRYQTSENFMYQQPMSEKSLTVFAVLGFFFGGLGIHDFYRGKFQYGIIYSVVSFFPSCLFRFCTVCGLGRLYHLYLNETYILTAIYFFLEFVSSLLIGVEIILVRKDSKNQLMGGACAVSIVLGIISILLRLAIILIYYYKRFCYMF